VRRPIGRISLLPSANLSGSSNSNEENEWESEVDEPYQGPSTSTAGTRPRIEPEDVLAVDGADPAPDQVPRRIPALRQRVTVGSQPVHRIALGGNTPPLIEHAEEQADQGELGEHHARRGGGSRWNSKDMDFLWTARKDCEVNCACTWDAFNLKHWTPARTCVPAKVDTARTSRGLQQQYYKLEKRLYQPAHVEIPATQEDNVQPQLPLREEAEIEVELFHGNMVEDLDEPGEIRQVDMLPTPEEIEHTAGGTLMPQANSTPDRLKEHETETGLAPVKDVTSTPYEDERDCAEKNRLRKLFLRA
jgi:hypothetical protein